MSSELAQGFQDFKEIKKIEWKDETQEKRVSVSEFLRNHFKLPIDSREKQRYDSLSELHISGMNDAYGKLIRGEVMANEVKTFYENGKPEKIRVVFVSENSGSMDVYLVGKALEDYLNSIVSSK